MFYLQNKCEGYLPEEQGTFGEIEVTVNSISEREGYILRQLTLKVFISIWFEIQCDWILIDLITEKTVSVILCFQYLNQQHTVRHYWYTAWPDHKAPDTARQLLELVKEVERWRYHPVTKVMRGPVTVHCRYADLAKSPSPIEKLWGLPW